jgi:predicted CxxxxCH...CXXCH cytochrome family protein
MAFRSRPPRFIALASGAFLCASLAACMEVANDLENDGGGGTDGACGQCHGAQGNSAAHAAHLSGTGVFNKSYACSECHPVPTTGTYDGTHMNAAVDVVFPEGGLARAGGADPVWNSTFHSCEGVYCHGATLGGGANTEPSWSASSLLGPYNQCGACHSIPPPSPHPQEDDESCSECHEGAISGGQPNPATHIDGVVQGGGDDKALGAQP